MSATLTLWLVVIGFATVCGLFTWGTSFALLYPAALSDSFTGLFDTWAISWLHLALCILWFSIFGVSLISVLFDGCFGTLKRHRKWSFLKLSFFGFFLSLILTIMSWGIWSHYGELLDRRFNLLTPTNAALPPASTLPQTVSYINSLRALDSSNSLIDFNIVYIGHHYMTLILTTFIALRCLNYFFVHFLFKEEDEKKRSKKLNVGSKSTDSSIALMQ